ncbi:large conductance mechanosensitive channel protein MscL [Streptacidiphilus fuscans]|uniref:Large conductance mechanosensitive channel protein MscL n=1 Tax=Streptacidiphilus fuscans TaxID=2789292 RepID=A0A931BCA6_9ACTN|nr:large conductance mechanosensitive channel protein MscL [Streptacidiphilus fuscans]MBF9070800.1 large conductance mechanosensitive channel protein MscL [Streptacidiphilus fuscans]
MKGFRKFLLRGNVVDLAVGIVIGAAFTAVVNGFVTAFLTPIIGLVTRQSGNFNNAVFNVNGVKFPYGAFIGAAISFVIVAAVVYFCVVLPVNKLTEKFTPASEDVEAPKKDCPECLSSIPVAATRCSFCTVELAEARQPAVSLPKQ